MPQQNDFPVRAVSVVIISKDEPSLGDTLDVMRAQCDEIGAECVVVDASKGALADIKGAHPWVRWHNFTSPEGREITIPHQRNVGVRVAKGDVVAFCDSGGIPAAGWLARLTAPVLAGDAVATGGPIRSSRHTSYGTLNDVPTGGRIRKVVTCNFAFTRTLFDKIGGFDERFDYGSDTEFGWRIEDAGEHVTSVEDAVVTIDWGSRRRQLKRDLRYGEAKARQLVLCPSHRRRILRESPEVLVYPLVFLTLPLGIAAALGTGRWEVLVPWGAALVALVVRDLSCRRPVSSIVDHVVVTLGLVHEWVRGAFAALRRPSASPGLSREQA